MRTETNTEKRVRALVEQAQNADFQVTRPYPDEDPEHWESWWLHQRNGNIDSIVLHNHKLFSCQMMGLGYRRHTHHTVSLRVFEDTWRGRIANR